MLVADIRRTVAAHYGLTDAEMLAPCRQRRVARPRQVAMYLATELTSKPSALIGRVFQRDGSTVRYARRFVSRARLRDTRMAADIFAILGRLPA